MECFLQNAHHQRNPARPVKAKSGSRSQRSFSTKPRMSTSGFLVRRLYGETEMSQQKSSTAVSSKYDSPASSNTIMRFVLPRMLSYSVPLGMPYVDDASVKRIFCVTIACIASFNCGCVHVGAFIFSKLDEAEDEGASKATQTKLHNTATKQKVQAK